MKEKFLKIIKDKKYLLISIAAVFVFVIILINVLNGQMQSFDLTIYNAIISLKIDILTSIVKIITLFGDKEILILITILSLIFVKNKKLGCSIAVNLASVGLINHILKEIIRRERPPLEIRMVEETSFSFPSGHSMASFAFYGLIIYFICKYLKNKKIKNLFCIALGFLIFLIGISRIYLGVHYASDVIAGFAFSTIYLITYITIIKKYI